MTAASRPFTRALVTGCAGFLGSHLSEQLIADGVGVLGVDRFSDYYSPALKERNVRELIDEPKFELIRANLSVDRLDELMDGVDVVFHLAARAGVRGSFGAAFGDYLSDNVLATQRLLEASVGRDLAAFVYASSSSVYGHAGKPVGETCHRRAVSAYGVTKIAVEDLASLYHRTEGLPVIGLRYFTVYGPRQRPDMAFARFIDHALKRDPIPVYGDGSQLRDFTYVDDVIHGTIAAASAGRAGLVYNIGAGSPARLMDAISTLQELLQMPISVQHVDPTRGEARHTNSNGSRAKADLGFKACWSLRSGLESQVEWTLAQVSAPTAHHRSNGRASSNGHARSNGHVRSSTYKSSDQAVRSNGRAEIRVVGSDAAHAKGDS